MMIFITGRLKHDASVGPLWHAELEVTGFLWQITEVNIQQILSCKNCIQNCFSNGLVWSSKLTEQKEKQLSLALAEMNMIHLNAQIFDSS